MRKREIIEQTLRDVKTEGLDPDYEAVVIGELQRRLPDAEIKTCDDFRHLNVKCDESCHKSYPHYDMKLIDLPEGSKAWVCDPVEWAIYPERRQQLEERLRTSPEGKLLRSIFRDFDPDDSSSE